MAAGHVPFARRNDELGIAVVGHRGAHAYAPENTMAAFRLAHELGADAVELDVHLTADDQLVVMHDDLLDRTTSGSGPIRQQRWEDIAGLSAGAWFGPQFAGERIPRLEDVLVWARATGMALSIELKRPNPALGRAAYPDLGARVVDMVRGHDLAPQVLVFSDDHAAVRGVRDLAPEVATSITLGGATFIDPVGLARAAGADGIAIYWSYASRQVVETCHAAGLHIFGFGVGDDLSRVTELRAMIANGTDFVSGGAPDQLRALVQSWQAQLGI